MNHDLLYIGIFGLSVYTFALFYTVNKMLTYAWRRCPHRTTLKLSSIQKQKCADCYALIDWPLKEGQQPLVSSNRDKRTK